MPGFTIRPATISDAPDIAAIARLARATAMPWLPVLHTIEGDISFYSRRVLPELRVELAERDGQICGFSGVEDDWLSQLYIHPDHWRTGLGSALLQRAMEGAEFLQLWVFEQNLAAQAFYAHHGFAEAERTDGANNEEKCPDVRMTWSARHGQDAPS